VEEHKSHSEFQGCFLGGVCYTPKLLSIRLSSDTY